MNAKLIYIKENTCVRPVMESGLLEELIDQFCDLLRRVLMAVVAERQRSTTPKPRDGRSIRGIGAFKRPSRRLWIVSEVLEELSARGGRAVYAIIVAPRQKADPAGQGLRDRFRRPVGSLVKFTSSAVLGFIGCVGLLLGAGSVQAQKAGQGGEAPPTDTTVVSGNPQVQVKLGGRVHRMIQLVADGRETDVFFTDNDLFPTMLRVDATAQVDDELTVGGALEIGFQQNRPLFVSQDNPEIDIAVTGRSAEIYVAAKVGKFSLGRGWMASWVQPEIDLSGTQRANLLIIGALFGGLKFVDATTNELTDIRVLTHHADLQRFLIKDRLRYDSPRLLGLQASASLAAADRWDVVVRTGHHVGDFRLVGAATYQNKPFGDLDWRAEAGVSFRHEPTGLNATGAGFTQRPSDGRNAHGMIVKVGWLAGLVPIGKTAFSADIASNFNIAIDGDDGDSFGVFALQNWDQLGIRAYIGIRHYDLDRPDVNLKRITVVPFGALIRF